MAGESNLIPYYTHVIESLNGLVEYSEKHPELFEEGATERIEEALELLTEGIVTEKTRARFASYEKSQETKRRNSPDSFESWREPGRSREYSRSGWTGIMP